MWRSAFADVEDHPEACATSLVVLRQLMPAYEVFPEPEGGSILL